MPADRQMAIDLIDEACAAGARQARACAVLEIDVRTLRRWQQQQRDEQRLVDRRRETAADRVPETLVAQLKPGGRMVIPIGVTWQVLAVVSRDAEGRVNRNDLLPVRFVPFVEGRGGA